jgi:hypothetical protein
MRQHFIMIVVLLLLAVYASACRSDPTAVPTIPVATNVPVTLEISDFSVTPLSDREVAINACTRGYGGVGITLRVSYNASPAGDDTSEWLVLKELGVPCFNFDDRPIWDISQIEPGRYLVRVEAKTADDPDWTYPITKTLIYDVK